MSKLQVYAELPDKMEYLWKVIIAFEDYPFKTLVAITEKVHGLSIPATTAVTIMMAHPLKATAMKYVS